MVHHYVSPCMCSTGISLTLWTKKLFCYIQNKNEKNVRHWNEVKKRKKKENLDSLLVWDQHFPGLAAVSVWVCVSFTLCIVHAHCMAPRVQIPNSWDSFSLSAWYCPKTVSLVLYSQKFLVCLSIPKKSTEFSFRVLFYICCQTFSTVWQHINLLNSSRHKCFSTSTLRILWHLG